MFFCFDCFLLAPHPPLTRSPFSRRRRRGGGCCLCSLRFFSFARASLQAILFYGGRLYSDLAFPVTMPGCRPILADFSFGCCLPYLAIAQFSPTFCLKVARLSNFCPILAGFFQLVAVGFHMHIRGISPPIIKQKPQKINRRFWRPPFLLRTTAPLPAFSRGRRCQPKADG